MRGSCPFYSCRLIWHAAYAMMFLVGMIMRSFYVFYDRHAPDTGSESGPPLAFFGVLGLGLALGNGRMGLEPRFELSTHQGESGGMAARFL